MNLVLGVAARAGGLTHSHRVSRWPAWDQQTPHLGRGGIHTLTCSGSLDDSLTSTASPGANRRVSLRMPIGQRCLTIHVAK